VKIDIKSVFLKKIPTNVSVKKENVFFADIYRYNEYEYPELVPVKINDKVTKLEAQEGCGYLHSEKALVVKTREGYYYEPEKLTTTDDYYNLIFARDPELYDCDDEFVIMGEEPYDTNLLYVDPDSLQRVYSDNDRDFGPRVSIYALQIKASYRKARSKK